MYIKPPSTAPYSIRQLRIDNPDTSFPAEPNDAILAAWGVYPVEVLSVPDHDQLTHQVVQLEPAKIGDKWVQGWGVRPLSNDDLRQAFKAQRAEAVQNITVTTAAGNTFDGDEVSQGRMARAILALPEGQTVSWVLHDNTVIEASAAELREALALAGAEQARFWISPRTNPEPS